MKMLAILSSPKTDGNVAKMLEIAMKKAHQIGYEVIFMNLYEKNITWCTGCMACKKAGSCVINDDIKEIEMHLKTCDLVAIASPTYFANVPAPLKNMFDRLVGFVMDDNKSFIPKPKLSPAQKYLILVTCSTPPPFDKLAKQSTGTTKAIKEVFHIAGMKPAGTVIFAGTRNQNKLPQKIVKQINSAVGRCGS